MKRMIPGLSGAGVVVLFVSVLHAAPHIPSVKPGFPACESFGIQRFADKKAALPFKLKNFEGQPLSLVDFKGKPVLLTFWLTYCVACKEELPSIEKFFEGKKDQLQIVSIVADGEKEKKAQEIVKKYKLTFPVLLDFRERISQAYGVKMVPTSFLIDQEGQLLGMIVGQREWAGPEAWSAISELLSLH
jgi:peroxiredoxin